MGAILLGVAAYELVKWRAKSAPGWKVALFTAAGLFWLLRDGLAGHDPLLLTVFELVVCVAAGIWTARRELAGAATRAWQIILAAAVLLVAADIIAAGGPGAWWKSAEAELSRGYSDGHADAK